MKALRVVSLFVGLWVAITTGRANAEEAAHARAVKASGKAGATTAPAEKNGRRWDFDKDAVGKLPPGWIIKQNNPTKELATWAVEPDPKAPSKPNVFSLKTENGDATFNLAIIEKTSYKDLDLSVKIRGNAGKEDQGGGLIWRCKDENNYYICRINPLENNYRVYKVVDGKRKMLKSTEAVTPTAQWVTLRVTMRGGEILCYLDGKKMLEAADDTFKDAGMIGLWTKADASSSFDDLTVRAFGGKAAAKDAKERGSAHEGSDEKTEREGAQKAKD